MPHTAVSNQQRRRAKSLRQQMTRAETLLWRYLKAHRVDGLGFRRQVPMGAYIADFACHALRMIVELDGQSHDFDERQRSDRARDAWFAAQGYVVLRFTNDEVMSNLDGVIAAIGETARSRTGNAPPSLSLPHKGRGNPKTTADRLASPGRSPGDAQ